jgi:predicted nucleic acid-binding protein
MSEKAIAIVDASFWIHLIKINLLQLFLEYYKTIVVPSKVEREITWSESFKFMIYTPEDIKQYNKLKKEDIIIIKEPKVIKQQLKSQVSKDSGELYCIALAQETGYIVFIDNGKPYNYCNENNILVANIIEFMLFLYTEQKLTKKEIYVKINLIKNSIPISYLKEIENYL